MKKFEEKELIFIISKHPQWTLIAQENEFFLKAENYDCSICFISFPIHPPFPKGVFHLFIVDEDAKESENSNYKLPEKELGILDFFENLKNKSKDKLFNLTKEELLKALN